MGKDQGYTILREAAKKHRVRFTYILDADRATSTASNKEARVPFPDTLKNLLVGLHEIGHIALDHRRYKDTGVGKFDTKKSIVLAQERAAWRYAIFEADRHGVEIDHHALHACRCYYQQYVSQPDSWYIRL